MPLFMDRHDVPGATAEDVANAHVSDLEASRGSGVQFISYWFDGDAGGVFCSANAPSREALTEVHNRSHGLVPNEIIEVSQDDVFKFLGSVHDPQDASELTSALRAVMFTDLVGSREILGSVGEGRFMEVLKTHDGVVREALYRHKGHEVKHTGDGIMAAFDAGDDAVDAARSIIAGFGGLEPAESHELRVRIGMAAGQPVARNDDIYGEAVVLASRLCDAADPQQILVAESVCDHAAGKAGFVSPELLTLKGFADPVPVYQVTDSDAQLTTDTAPPYESAPPTTRSPETKRSLWTRIFGKRT